MGIVWFYFYMILVGWFICNEQRCAWIIRLVDIETDVYAWEIRYNLMFCCNVRCSDIALDIDFWTLVDASELLCSCFMCADDIWLCWMRCVECDIFLYLFLCCFCVGLIFGVIWILCFFCWFVGFCVDCFDFLCIACRFIVFVVCGWTTLGPFWLICPLCPFKRTPLLTYANNPQNLAFTEDNICTMGLFFVRHSFTWNYTRYFKVAAFYIKRQVFNSFNSFNKNFQQPN